jgi:anti-sigma factor RsiW
VLPSCRQVTELVTDWAEGRLSLADRLRFQAHLGLCRGCRAYVRQVKAAARAAGRLPPPELPKPLEEELARRFQGWTARRPSGDGGADRGA